METGVTREWDFFISHASEDKVAIALPLADELRRAGFNVWFDAFELRVGDSLRARIDEGLANSRFGVVILSKAFFAKRWATAELGALFALDDGDEPRILPVWHGLSQQEVARQSPLLADRLAITCDSPPEIASQLVAQLGARLGEPATVQRRLLKALDGGLVEDVAAFLAHYPKQLAFATRLTGGEWISGTARPRVAPAPSPDFLLEMAIVPSRMEYGFAYVTLGPIDTTADSEEDIAEIQRLVRMTDEYVAVLSRRDPSGSSKFSVSGFVVAGRRGKRKPLNRSSYTDIRSYDWLIDAFDGAPPQGRASRGMDVAELHLGR